LQDKLSFLRNIQIFKKNLTKYCGKYILPDLMCSIPVRLGTPLSNGATLTKPLLAVCPGSLGEPLRGDATFATLTVRKNGILAGFGTL